MTQDKRIFIYDSTLRDGAQAEGISYSVGDKLKIVEALDELGIEYIEAGNPASNIKDMEFFAELKKIELKHATIAAFGSTRKCNIEAKDDAGLNSLLSANTKVVTIFGKGWDFHVTDVLKTTLEENIKMISDSIAYLKSHNRRVFFDSEHFFDGYKRNPEYALATLIAAEESGAEVIILCDTNGGTFPNEIYDIVKIVKKYIKVEIGIHTHNDTGQGVANSMMGVFAGVSQVQGTLAGFGERTGNANLSTIIGNLEAKLGYKCLANGSLLLLKAITLRICEIANISLDDQMPYVGKSAFAHKAGMHIDAVLKATESFEHIDPSMVGNSRRFLLSEVAGRGTILRKIKKIDESIQKDDPLVANVVNKVKEMEYLGYQYEGADASFALIVYKEMNMYKSFFTIEDFKIISGNPTTSERISAQAIVKVGVENKINLVAAEGDGPINAIDIALRKALEEFYPIFKDVHLTDFKVRVLDTNVGTSARVRVLIETTDGKMIWNTVGVSTNIIEASWIALIDALEYKLHNEYKR